jgi:hypothetical protein
MRIVPSQIIAFLYANFPNNQSDLTDVPVLHQPHHRIVAILLDLLDRLPAELLVLSPEETAHYAIATSAISLANHLWASGRLDGAVKPMKELNDRHPVKVIFDLLAKSKDEAASADTASLKFIKDKAFRETLRLDISGATRALNNREWKAATVLAGSIIEALLLWKLRTKSTAARTAADQLVKTGVLSRKPDTNLDRWVLHELIEVAAYLNIIESTTAAGARLARDFRNLIHPGKAIRTGLQATLGGAQVALGALDFVIQDLSR